MKLAGYRRIRCRGNKRPGFTVWHLDEVYLKIDGRLIYLWRAVVDGEGEVLDVLVQTKRNKAAALKLMRKLLKKYGFMPQILFTDDGLSGSSPTSATKCVLPTTTLLICPSVAE
jgi:transposase-like protein